MADWQGMFLSSVVLNEDIQTAVKAGITPAFFRDDSYRIVYEYALDHWNQYGTPPDEQVMSHAFPAMTWAPQKQPLPYLIERMRKARKDAILTTGLTEASQYFNTQEPDKIESILQDSLIQARLETSVALDEDFVLRRTPVEDALLSRMAGGGQLRGISTGFDGIDWVTGGFQPEQFIVLFGTPKSFKSATLLAMAKAVHEQAKVALFVGFEMSAVEQEDRLVSLHSAVSLTKIINGTLTAREFDTISKALSKVEGMRPFIFSTDITTTTTVGAIQAKIKDYQPDVVFIDGAYMMLPESDKLEPGSPQAMTSISRSLKRLAQSERIPIVVTTQASLTRSKGGLHLGSGMYTQAWGQDCDVLLGVEKLPSEEDARETDPVFVKFRVLESRSGPRKDTVLYWDWNHGSVHELDHDEMLAALKPESRAKVWDS